MADFDPDGAAPPDSSIFGLPPNPDRVGVALIPVPFAATASYGGGAEKGPAAVLAASRQVDLHDFHFGRIHTKGIILEPADPRIEQAHAAARALALPILARGGAGPGDGDAVRAIDEAGALVERITHERTARRLDAGITPGILGGDHSVPLGAIRAAVERHEGLGILHVDAHADLRPGFEGFRQSHASIMHHVAALEGVGRIVQVGVRDFCEQELRAIARSDGRIVTHFDQEWFRRRASGEPFDSLCREAISALPPEVWVSFDIDGLDPSLCPHTGTPVPGGLMFPEAAHLLGALADNGRRVVGFDLCEVSPGEGTPGRDSWDANVGARVLYKLCGLAG
ncbi:MAG: agmatinase family protein [Planctomycetota bacterium]